MPHPISNRALRCSRPMIFEYEELPETPYRYNGTVCFVWWAGYLFALTARHVLDKQDLTTVRLLCHDTDRTFLGFDSTARILGDEDYHDLAIFSVTMDFLCGALAQGHAALDPSIIQSGRSAYERGRQLVVTGYPGERKRVKYDEDKLSHQRLIATAEYVSPDSSRQHIHELRWDNTAGVNEMAGMSGSAVLSEADDGEFGFAGVLIQASNASAPGHFIDSAVVQSMLRRSTADRLQREAAKKEA